MRHSVSCDLHRYWDALRHGRTAPERREVDPAAIRHILAHTFILEVSQSAAARRRKVSFRLSGTRLDALFQRDLRTCDFCSIWAPESVGDASAMLDLALDDRSVAVASVRGGPAGCQPIDLELLLLPLHHHGRTQDRVLGSLAASTGSGWMGLRPVEPLAVTSFRALTGRLTQGGPQSGRGSLDLPVSAGHPPLESRPGGVLQVGSFRVYEGGRRHDARSGTEI